MVFLKSTQFHNFLFSVYWKGAFIMSIKNIEEMILHEKEINLFHIQIYDVVITYVNP